MIIKNQEISKAVLISSVFKTKKTCIHGHRLNLWNKIIVSFVVSSRSWVKNSRVGRYTPKQTNKQTVSDSSIWKKIAFAWFLKQLSRGGIHYFISVHILLKLSNFILFLLFGRYVLHVGFGVTITWSVLQADVGLCKCLSYAI